MTDINLNSPNKGLPEHMIDVPVDTPAGGDGVGVLSEVETEELKSELIKVQLECWAESYMPWDNLS